MSIVVSRLAGRYRLLDRLGAGGMSVVWRAHDEVLDREVAVKVLSPELARRPHLVDRVLREARSAARLRHPHVIEVHDYGETEDHLPYVVMELVDGRSLADVLAGGALPWRSAALICAQVAAALAAAHACGIVHRDVKPSNVMITSGGVKLVDFGISAAVGEADGIGGEVYGTPAYLAPERLDGGAVRPATDVYALGLLLYLTLAGRLPWEASTTTQMLRAHRYVKPAALPPVPGLPRAVADLCRRSLSKSPGDRPVAVVAARILADAAGASPAAPVLPADDSPTVSIPAVRRRARLAAAVAAVLVSLAGAVWLGHRSGAAIDEAPAAAAPAPPGPSCTVGYRIRSVAGGRLATAVTIANTGASPAAAWRLTFVLPDGQRLVRGWSETWAQEGQAVQVHGSTLPAGGRVTTGFDASYRDATTLPAEFRLNGTLCPAQMSVAGATATPSATVRTVKPAVEEPAAKPKSGKGKSGNEKSKSGKSDDDEDEDDEGDD